METQTIPHFSPGKYAVRHVDNWDGQGCIVMTFASLDTQGVWTVTESGDPLLVYKGDKVLQAWPLEVNATPAGEIVGVKREWLQSWAEDLTYHAQDGSGMRQQIEHLLELHPKPKVAP